MFINKNIIPYFYKHFKRFNLKELTVFLLSALILSLFKSYKHSALFRIKAAKASEFMYFHGNAFEFFNDHFLELQSGSFVLI